MDLSVAHEPQHIDDLCVMLWSGEQVRYIWDEVEQIFRNDDEYFAEYFTPEYVYDVLLRGRFVLWTAADAGGVTLVMLTEILDFPVRSLVRVIYIGGSGMKRIMSMIDLLHLWAKRQGTRRVEVSGRCGLVRLLEPYGYEYHSINLVRELDDIKEH